MNYSYLPDFEENKRIGKFLVDLIFDGNDRITEFLEKLIQVYGFDRIQVFMENMELPTYFVGKKNISFCDVEYCTKDFYRKVLGEENCVFILEDVKSLEETEPELYSAITKRYISSVFQYVMLGEEQEVIGMISFEYCKQTVKYPNSDREVLIFICEILEKLCWRACNQPGKDMLTSLDDKNWVRQCIENYLSSVQEPGALIIIDIDNFLRVNEELGHVFGNQVLISVARTIKGIFRNSDIIGRIGGDEFLVFVKDIKDRDLIVQRANVVSDAIRKVYAGETKTTQISASIGISLYPEDGIEFQTLYQKAESALRYVQEHHGAGFSIYDKNIHRLTEESGQTIIKDQPLTEVESEEEFERFYYEFTELTFRLMEETRNVDSAVNLLLYKLKEHFRFSITAIQEITEQPRTLRCRYENCDEGFAMKCGLDIVYTEKEWFTLYNTMMQEGYYVFNPERVRRGEEVDVYQNHAQFIKSAIKIPLMNNNCFIGVVEFVDTKVEHRWTERDIRFLKSFCRIISVYLNRIQAYEDANIMMKQMNERDELTGLYKYETFKQRMEEMKTTLKKGEEIAYIYSDISHFKYINETYGYDVGNRILKRFARSSINNNPKLLCASRVHSDNIILAVATKMGSNELLILINQMNQQMEQEFQKEYRDHSLIINSGLYMTSDADSSVEEDVYNANYARKEAKKNGDGKCILFTEGLMEEYRKELRYVAELPNAIRNKELTVYIQPKVDGTTHEVLGGEALVRWIKPDGTLVYPNEFIPVFERTGDIVQLDFYVYREVFAYLRRRMDEGKKVVPISMNVSRIHLDNQDFINCIEELLQTYQIDTKWIEFEVTESIYLDNVESLLKMISWLEQKKIRISMDDFGTGYSSLNILSKLPVDVLKLDRIFLENEDIKETDKIILSSIIYMAKQLNMTVVCEGVETEGQSNFLGGIGCDLLQGYFFGRPMSMDAFATYLQESS